MYGSSYKYGLKTHDFRSTPVEILDSGQNRTADTMAQHLERASHIVVVFLLLLTGRTCSYFLQKNGEIQRGTVKGVTINLKVLGIGNGLTVRPRDISLADLLLITPIRTHFRSTLATFNTLSRIHITL